MSHVGNYATTIKVEKALLSALKSMGITIKRNALVRVYDGASVTADIVAKFKSYDIGFNKKPDGTYEIATDKWGLDRDASVMEICAKHGQTDRRSRADNLIGLITQHYNFETTKAKAKRLGMMGSKAVHHDDGRITYEIIAD